MVIDNLFTLIRRTKCSLCFHVPATVPLDLLYVCRQQHCVHPDGAVRADGKYACPSVRGERCTQRFFPEAKGRVGGQHEGQGKD